MSNDQVTIWGGGLKFGREPEDGELLIGNGSNFDLAAITAGSGISISNASGSITISATAGGTVTAVTATSPLKSTGGTTPDISLNGTVGVSNGGTGATALTAENVLLGNGASAVKFVAPGASGNLLTSNGTTWTSNPPPVQWNFLIKSSDQSITSTTVDTNVTGLQISVASNKEYLVRGTIIVHHSSGGAVLSFDGPASPTQLNATTYNTTNFGLNSLSSGYLSSLFQTSLTASQSWSIPVNFFIRNGSNAGIFTLVFRQFSSNANPTTIRKGSWIEWQELS